MTGPDGFPDVASPRRVPTPLFADPVYHGSCDPEIVWDADLGRWLIFYTARRALRPELPPGGTPIGVASSPDLVEWRFDGYAGFRGPGEEFGGSPDLPVTCWAPAVIAADHELHMFLTVKPTAAPPWNGTIRHYVAPCSEPLSGWRRLADPQCPGPGPIDATVAYDTARQTYRLWYLVATVAASSTPAVRTCSAGSITVPSRGSTTAPASVTRRRRTSSSWPVAGGC